MTTAAERRRASDEGMTLIDLMVSMTLMSVVMAIFTTGVVDMYRTANKAGAAAETQTRMLAAFNRLEREVRYAQHVYPPRTLPNGTFAVEYILVDAANVQQCVRLMLPLNGGDLTRNQWVATGAPTTSATIIADGVTRIRETRTASGVTTTETLDPFLVKAAGTGDSNFDRLEVRLSTTSGNSIAGVTRAFKLQYTALNTVSTKSMTTLPTCTA